MNADTALEPSPNSPTVFITGAASGIGEATALRLDAEGFRVFAGVRRPSDADSLRRRASGQLTPVLLDVTDAAGIAAAVEQVAAGVGRYGLQGLVNNAGISVSGIIEFLDIDALRHQLEVNLIGTVAVTKAFIPMLRSGGGRVVNISSDSGLLSAPFVSPYSMSKFGIEAFSDALRRELYRWNMRVVIVEPGAIATPMWGKGISMSEDLRGGLTPEAEALYGSACGKYQQYLETGAAGAIPVERVADTIHHALTRRWPRTRYQVGRDAKFARFASRFLPTRLMDTLVAKSFS